MKGPRRQFLPHAGLAGHQHDLRVRRQALDEAEELLHDGAPAHHPAEFELSRHLALQRDHLLRRSSSTRISVSTWRTRSRVERLGRDSSRAQADRFDRAATAA
jgi:hypothetical protein